MNKNMKKGLLIFFIVLLFGILIGFPMMLADSNNSGSNNQSNVISAGNNNSVNDSGENVCCHIYGLGAHMRKVNSQYELMEEANCTVPEDFVGGGREIVSEKRCEEGYTVRVQTAIQSRNRLRLNASEIPEDCTITGSVIKCHIEGGRVMAIMAGKSGNTIIKFKGGNVSTRAELYHHNGQVYGVFGNETKPIEYFPEQLRQIIRERTWARLNNTNITLNENGTYEYEAEKEARFLGLFKVKEKVKWYIDSETGEIIRERGPWWGFLARDIDQVSRKVTLCHIPPGDPSAAHTISVGSPAASAHLAHGDYEGACEGEAPPEEPEEPEDEESPQWFDNSTNSTINGTSIDHSVRWTDDTNLSGYIFSFDDGTGTFANDSFVSFTGTNNWSNVTKVVNSTVNSTIRWKVSANDTSNNWNETDVFSYNITVV